MIGCQESGIPHKNSIRGEKESPMEITRKHVGLLCSVSVTAIVLHFCSINIPSGTFFWKDVSRASFKLAVSAWSKQTTSKATGAVHSCHLHPAGSLHHCRTFVFWWLWDSSAPILCSSFPLGFPPWRCLLSVPSAGWTQCS